MGDEKAAAEATAAEGPEAVLRRKGMHVTAQRVAVMRAVAERSHATADDIYRDVQADLGAVSRQAVYDALAALTDRDVFRRIEPAGSPARYETRVADNHHHLICRSCRRTVDIDCAVGYTPCLSAADDHGFTIDEAEVVYWGLCPDCAPAADALERQPSTASTPTRARTRPTPRQRRHP